MSRSKRVERKPLSFSTTMRNPERIAEFVESLIEFEGEILTNNIIKLIVKKWIIDKLIRPDSVLKIEPELRKIYKDKHEKYSEQQAEYIYVRTEKITKGHKEAGFDKGWPSRFDTYMRLPMEFGFVFYKMGRPIEISQTGKMLVRSHNIATNANREKSDRAYKISDIFLNSLVKYQTNNPFRRNLIENAPFVLFLQTIKKLSEGFDWEKKGIYRSEIPFIICWPDANAYELAEYISNFREIYGKMPSNEVVYEKCLELLESENRKRFKLSQITKEGVDDFIRKLRITGLVSLRGGGRLIDINSFESDRANYIINEYSNYELFEDEHSYYEYMGKIDSTLLETHTIVSDSDIKDVRQKNLIKWVNEMKVDDIVKELKSLMNRNGSTHPILKFISGPTRFEFLMSIALKHQYPDLEIKPNYPVDDEGMPTFTAKGGIGDIEVYGDLVDVLVEVTLMQDKSQSTNEIPGITRHMKEFKKNKNKEVFSLFIAPLIHEDTQYMIEFSKARDNVDIYPFTIKDFSSKFPKTNKIKQLIE